MKFYSTNNHDHLVSLQEAVIKGLAPDQGLYMPEHIPLFPPSFFESLRERSFREIALAVARGFVEDQIPDEQLKKIIDHVIAFDAPLIEIEKNIFSLELFHGPTLAFKDFGARFMSQVLGYFSRQEKREIVVLVATSGDTGSAVANGFLGVQGTKVIVLYPAGKVSDIQERQFTTLGKNITAIEVDGSFDDCQRIVKKAFLDPGLNKNIFLTSANSINIARLIPQSFYYFYAWSRLPQKANVVFSVPSGNFGNLTAGLIAKKMGLPIQHFVASTNVNDVVPHYLSTSDFLPRPSVSTLSNAMDVGNPSNFARVVDLFGNDFHEIKKWITGYAFKDEETQAAMRGVFSKSKYLLDPHGAVAYLGLKKFQQQNTGINGVFLETAHPAKFKDVMENTLNTPITIPERLGIFLLGGKKTIACDASYDAVKKIIETVA